MAPRTLSTREVKERIEYYLQREKPTFAPSKALRLARPISTGVSILLIIAICVVWQDATFAPLEFFSFMAACMTVFLGYCYIRLRIGKEYSKQQHAFERTRPYIEYERKLFLQNHALPQYTVRTDPHVGLTRIWLWSSHPTEETEQLAREFIGDSPNITQDIKRWERKLEAKAVQLQQAAWKPYILDWHAEDQKTSR